MVNMCMHQSRDKKGTILLSDYYIVAAHAQHSLYRSCAYSSVQACIFERTFRVVPLRMPWRLGFDLAELGKILGRQVVPSEVKHGVLQRTGVSVTQHKAIAVDPSWVLGRVHHGFTPKKMRHGSATHGSSWMTGVRRLRLIG